MARQQNVLNKWTKSSYSAVNGDCVEIKAHDVRSIAVRDSKDPHGTVLTFSTDAWSAFIDGVTHGRIGQI